MGKEGADERSRIIAAGGEDGAQGSGIPTMMGRKEQIETGFSCSNAGKRTWNRKRKGSRGKKRREY